VEQAEVDADGMPVLVKTDPVKPRNYKVFILILIGI
jgi:hypothetical protein